MQGQLSMKKNELKNLIRECFVEIKAKNAIRSLVNECLNEMGRGRPRKEDTIPVEADFYIQYPGGELKDVVYIHQLRGHPVKQDEVAKELGFVSIPTIGPNGVYVKNQLYQQFQSLFDKPETSVRDVARLADQYFETHTDDAIELSEKLAQHFLKYYRRDFVKNVYVRTRGKDTQTVDFPQPQPEEQLEESKKPSPKTTLRNLIREAIDEMKDTQKKTLSEMVEELDKEVKKTNKESGVVEDDYGDFVIDSCPPHHFRVRHQYDEVFDVTYFKDKTDREKKLGMKFEEVKKYVSERLKDKDGNYVQKEFNKSAENSNDQVKKVSELPVNKTGEVVKKEIKDTKKEDKDYNEAPPKDAVDQGAPLKEVDKIKKQSDHSVKGEQVKYEMPKQKDKKLVVKAGKTNRRFKGLPSGK